MASRSSLAILGGEPVLAEPLRPYPSIGPAERAAALRVLDSGKLSGFYGSWGAEFWGGPEVRAFEEEWARHFGVPHAVTVNSATSGLTAAMGAIGIAPGDEVIVPPLTMSATVVAPLAYGGIPVFADLEPDTFTLDPEAVRAAITPRTKAILAVNLFGQPARLQELRELADERGLWLVEDNAQAPTAREHGRFAGTVGHLGVFSLNYHKHIHTGEGGVVVTRDPDLARKVQLIRNHGENVVEHLGITDLAGLVGHNLRLGELAAAIGRAQLRDVDRHVARRVHLAEALTDGVADLPGFDAPRVREGCSHVYYLWCLKVDEARLGATRSQVSRALAAEGFPNWQGYVRPLYRLPVFQQRVALRGGFPFNLAPGRTYPPGLCPVAERLWSRELLCFEPCAHDVGPSETKLLVEALRKVHAHRRDLAQLPPEA